MSEKNSSKKPLVSEREVKTTSENLMIPKHRFDCINLCLKETKNALAEKMCEAELANAQISRLEKALLESVVETKLAENRAKSLKAAKALLDISNLRLEHDGNVPGLEEEILRIKNSQSYLFENDENAAYVILPLKSGEMLNKTITNYIKRTEKQDERIK